MCWGQEVQWSIACLLVQVKVYVLQAQPDTVAIQKCCFYKCSLCEWECGFVVPGVAPRMMSQIPCAYLGV